jgi:hypothetical protein
VADEYEQDQWSPVDIVNAMLGDEFSDEADRHMLLPLPLAGVTGPLAVNTTATTYSLPILAVCSSLPSGSATGSSGTGSGRKRSLVDVALAVVVAVPLAVTRTPSSA